MQAHRTVIRAGLLALGIPQLLIGAWALIDTRGWFDSFPGGGHHWLAAYGAYNQHLALDVGALFVALGGLLMMAALWPERRLVQASLITYLLYEVPHLVYHLGADDALPSGDQIVSDALLGLTVAVAVALLWLTRSPDPVSGTSAATPA